MTQMPSRRRPALVCAYSALLWAVRMFSEVLLFEFLDVNVGAGTYGEKRSAISPKRDEIILIAVLIVEKGYCALLNQEPVSIDLW